MIRRILKFFLRQTIPKFCTKQPFVFILIRVFLQLFEALFRVIDLLKHHDCLIEAESLSQLFHEMFPLWLSSIQIAFTRKLECAHAVDDVASITGFNQSLDDDADGGSQTHRVIDSLLQSSLFLLVIPSLDADLHQLFWDTVLHVCFHAVSAMTNAFSRDIQDVLIVEGGMSDSFADACIASCVQSLSPAQFLSDLDASRKENGLYITTTSWGRIMISFSSPIQFITTAILNRAIIAHRISRRVRDFAAYELNKSEDAIIALLPHASLMSLAERFLNVFDQAFHMACNMLTVLSLQWIEFTLAQEEVNVQMVVDEIYRTCQDMLESVDCINDPDTSASASSLIFEAVSKAFVMAAMQMKHGDVDGISFLDTIQVKIMVQLKSFIRDLDHDDQLKNGNRVNHSTYLDLFKCLIRSGIEVDVGVLLMPTQTLLFEHTKMRNGKVGNTPMGIRDLQAVLIRRARSGDSKAAEYLHSYLEEPNNWRKKFDVIDSETSFLVASCRMRHVSARKRGAIFSNDLWCRGVFILTKFHCAFIQDDVEEKSTSVCFILAQLSQFVSNHRKATISLSGLPKVSHTMFRIRVHIVDIVGIDEEVAVHFSLCGQTWSSPPLRRAKNSKAGVSDSASLWIEGRLICKDFSESHYPSKCQLAECPPLAVDTVPANLTAQIFKGSFLLGKGTINVGEVSSVVVNDLVIKIVLITGHSVDVRLFVTVVPSSSLQENVQQEVHVELGSFSRHREIADRFASHLSDIGLDDTISVNVIQDIVSNQDSSALGVDFSTLLPSGEQPRGKFSCTWLGQGGVFKKETPGTLVITDNSIYFFNRDRIKVLDLSIHMIADEGLKRVRYRLSDSALSMELFGEGNAKYAYSPNLPMRP